MQPFSGYLSVSELLQATLALSRARRAISPVLSIRAVELLHDCALLGDELAEQSLSPSSFTREKVLLLLVSRFESPTHHMIIEIFLTVLASNS